MRKDAQADRNFAATLLLESLGQTPADERELVRKTAGATLIVDAFADLKVMRMTLTSKG